MIWCVLCFALWCAVADEAPIDLCQVVQGFAPPRGVTPFRVNIQAKSELRPGEAYIFAVRPVPFRPEFSHVLTNVTYQYKGLMFSAISDDSQPGLVQLKGPLDTTVFNVAVTSTLDEMEEPFQLYAYHSGYSSCSMSFHRVFYGPIPSHIQNENVPATIVLEARPTEASGSFAVSLSGITSARVFSGPSLDKLDQELVLNQPQPFSSPTVFLKVVPDTSRVAVAMMFLSVAWSAAPGQPPVVPQSPPASLVPPPVTAPVEPSPAAHSGYFGFFVVLLVGYVVGRSLYNYRVRHVTAFPDFIPHNQFFGNCIGLVRDLAQKAKSKAPASVFRGRTGYAGVEEDGL